jgi:hypothetical protein
MAKWALRSQRREHSAGLCRFHDQRDRYRYQPKLSDENAVIADWLVRLTYN